MQHVYDPDEGEDYDVFFDDVQFARDGGFNEVSTLFQVDRFAWALLQIGCVVLNLAVIIPSSISTLSATLDELLVEPDGMSRHLLLNNLIGVFISGDRRAKPAALLAILELGMLLFHLCHLAWNLFSLFRTSDVVRWYPLATILWDTVPALGSFSAMKSLHFVTPKIFIPEFTRRLRLFYDDRNASQMLKLCQFLGARLVHAFVGMEAFMIKFIIAAEAHRSAASFFGALFVASAFLNQLLGVVDVSKFAQKRLFTFIFGGEDSFVDDYEKKVAKTWQAMLVMRMWERSKDYKPRLAWFLAVSLAYSDMDFQKLTLDPRRPSRVASKQTRES